MGDMQSCECGGFAEVIKDGKAMCNQCAGLPSIADKFKALQRDQREELIRAFRPEMRVPR